MTRSIDTIQQRLFARTPLPPLEPGKRVYDKDLVREIELLKAHKSVIAGEHRREHQHP